MVLINTKFCKGCQICVDFCPKHIIKLDDMQKAQIIDQSKCISCGFCELRCPDYAITVVKE
ncbi:MAG: 4Fe-4S dicluster domain-containing protein [Bacillota bacterium]